MASRGRTLTVYLAADTKKAKREIQGFSSFLKSDFVRGLGVAAAGAAAFQYAMDGITSGAAEADELAKLNTVLANLGFRESAADVQTWVDNTMYATNVADTELRGALQRLLPVTKDVTEAQNLLSTAIDAATGSGKPLATVVEALAKAAGGSTTSLLKLFPELRNVAGAADDAAIAVAALNTSYAGSASASVKSYAGQIANVKLALDELQESFGTGFLDSFSEAVGGSADATNDLTQALRDLQPVMDAVGGLFGEYLGNLANIAGGLTDAAKAVQDFAEESAWAQPIIEGLGGAVEFVANGPIISLINKLGGLIGQLRGAEDAAWDTATAIGSIPSDFDTGAFGGGNFGDGGASATAGTWNSGYVTQMQQANELARRRREAAANNNSYAASANNATAAVDRLTAAERRAREEAARHLAAFRSMRDEVYTDIAELNAAVESYRDAWIGAYDDINNRLTGGNDIGSWYSEYETLAQDIRDADKAVQDAIKSGDADAIAAANDRRRALGALPSLQDFIAGKVQANTDKANLIAQLFPNLVGTVEGRQILDSFTAMAPAAVQAFVTAYGQENIPALATLLQQQNATGTGPVAQMFADAGYWNGVNEAKQIVVGLQEQLLADEKKLREAGRTAGKAIGAGLKAAIIQSYNEAMAAIGVGGSGDPIARALSMNKTYATATRRLGV